MTSFMQWLDMYPLFWPVFIFCARVTDVSLGTLRTILIIRGSRFLAPSIAFFESLVWVTAVSGVLMHLDKWYNVVFYAAGFASGNAAGVLLEKKLAIGMQAIRLISKTRSAAVAQGLRLAGYGVTEVKGQGMAGEVSLSYIVVPRRETPTVVRVAEGVDPDVFATVEDVQPANLHIYRKPVPPTGWRAILKKK